jgi:ribonuclease R
VLPLRYPKKQLRIMAKRKTSTIAPPSALPQTNLFRNLLKTTSQYIQGKNFVSSSAAELMGKLNLPPQHAELFDVVLGELVAMHQLTFSKEQYRLVPPAPPAAFSGTIKMHPRGFGFVKLNPPSPYNEDIFIPKPFTMNAVDGDIVEVVVNPEISEKGPEGKVSAVVTRNRTHIAGIIRSISYDGEIEAYVPLLGAQRIVVETDGHFALDIGDRVVLQVIEWGDKFSPTICKPTHRLGHINDPSADIAAAIEEFQLRAEFPSRALLEAKSLGKTVSLHEIAKRENLRDLECVTIDPDTAKDFDDAITLTKDQKGHFHLGVHIADVSHYIQPGSALDAEAALRCNSTYFPGSCLPMLPGELSENLCSLKPDVNRLTLSVFMHLNDNGDLLNYRIARTVIRSAKRFSYREAKEVLDGKRRSKHADLLKRMVELCDLLKRHRRQRGSIEFSLPELVVKVDSKGIPMGTDYIAYDITHQMIEEFMLKANEVVALHLAKEGRGLAYRVHEEPSEENMQDFVTLAGTFGFKLSKKPTPQELQALFDETLQTPHGQYLATSYIRKMRQAIYSPENSGHYGLGLTHYCHFTSPIRRYVDLLTHRALFEEPIHAEQLNALATQCSEQERVSAKAENSVVLLKKLRLLEQMHSKEPSRSYEAVVTHVKAFGIHFELLELMLEGFLHISTLGDDYFIFDARHGRIHGRRSSAVYHSGSHLTVYLKEIDFIQLGSKWELLPDAEPAHYRRHKAAHRGRSRPPLARENGRPEKKTNALTADHPHRAAKRREKSADVEIIGKPQKDKESKVDKKQSSSAQTSSKPYKKLPIKEPKAKKLKVTKTEPPHKPSVALERKAPTESAKKAEKSTADKARAPRKSATTPERKAPSESAKKAEKSTADKVQAPRKSALASERKALPESGKKAEKLTADKAQAPRKSAVTPGRKAAPERAQKAAKPTADKAQTARKSAAVPEKTSPTSGRKKADKPQAPRETATPVQKKAKPAELKEAKKAMAKKPAAPTKRTVKKVGAPPIPAPATKGAAPKGRRRSPDSAKE